MERFRGVMRQKIINFLPSAFNRAICSYRTFSSKNVDMEETKEFSAYHTACKNALSHIDNLMKLSNIAEPIEEKVPDNSLHQILSDAKDQLEKMDAV